MVALQHLTALLASNEPEVLMAALQTLTIFVRKTHSSGVRWHGDQVLNSRLLSMAQGWGGKQEVRTAYHMPRVLFRSMFIY